MLVISTAAIVSLWSLRICVWHPLVWWQIHNFYITIYLSGLTHHTPRLENWDTAKLLAIIFIVAGFGASKHQLILRVDIVVLVVGNLVIHMKLLVVWFTLVLIGKFLVFSASLWCVSWHITIFIISSWWLRIRSHHCIIVVDIIRLWQDLI